MSNPLVHPRRNSLIHLLTSQQYALFTLIVIALIISLTFHEFGHAASAKYFGDDTAERAGRLNINPIAHIDPMGLLMVVLVGFGYARPVPTNPRNFTSRFATPLIAAAGPAMNLVLAFITVNIYLFGVKSGYDWFSEPGPQTFFVLLAQINLLLMLFNLIPLGPLDGHYILGYLLPSPLDSTYLQFNARYGHFVFLGLILLSVAGLPIFTGLMSFSQKLLPYLAVF